MVECQISKCSHRKKPKNPLILRKTKKKESHSLDTQKNDTSVFRCTLIAYFAKSIVEKRGENVFLGTGAIKLNLESPKNWPFLRLPTAHVKKLGPSHEFCIQLQIM